MRETVHSWNIYYSRRRRDVRSSIADFDGWHFRRADVGRPAARPDRWLAALNKSYVSLFVAAAAAAASMKHRACQPEMRSQFVFNGEASIVSSILLLSRDVVCRNLEPGERRGEAVNSLFYRVPKLACDSITEFVRTSYMR